MLLRLAGHDYVEVAAGGISVQEFLNFFIVARAGNADALSVGAEAFELKSVKVVNQYPVLISYNIINNCDAN